MNKYISQVSILAIALLLNTACTMSPINNRVAEPTDSGKVLLIYEDGQMEFNSRFINHEDVVIYNDGRGGERAAIKVRVPIHSDFYRDSIVVVRVEKQRQESVADSRDERMSSDNIN